MENFVTEVAKKLKDDEKKLADPKALEANRLEKTLGNLEAYLGSLTICEASTKQLKTLRVKLAELKQGYEKNFVMN